MSYGGVGRPTDYSESDPRFPFPHNPTPTRCRTEPKLFDLAHGDRGGESRAAAEKRLGKACRACSGCPIVKDCLRWALVNKPLTKVGRWASRRSVRNVALARSGSGSAAAGGASSASAALRASSATASEVKAPARRAAASPVTRYS